MRATTKNEWASWAALTAAGLGVYSNATGFADLFLGLAVVLAWPHVYRRKAVIWITVIVGPAAISAAWSNVPIDTLHFSARVAGVIFLANQRSWTIHASPAFLLLAALAISAVMQFGNPERDPGLSQNAVTMGEIGLVSLMTGTIPGAVMSVPMMSAMSTRSALGAAVVLAVLTRNRWVMLTVMYAGAAWVLAGITAGDVDRQLWRVVNIEILKRDTVDRLDSQVPGGRVVAIDTSQAIGERAVTEGVVDQLEDPQLHWLGYGVAAFNEKTGAQRPHSVPSTIIYELGILAVLPLLGILVAMATKLPWPHAITLALMYGTIVETPAGAAIGVFTIMWLTLFVKQKHFGMGFQSAWTVSGYAIWNWLVRSGRVGSVL